MSICERAQDHVNNVGRIVRHREVVEYAESVQKLFDDDGNNLGKKRLEAMTVYAEYTVDGDTATVTRVYKHRVSLEEDN